MTINYPQCSYNMQTHNYNHHHHGQYINDPFPTPINNMNDRGVGTDGEMINNGYMMNNMVMTNGVNNDHGNQDTNNNTISVDDYDLTYDGLRDLIMFDNNQESNPINIPQETTTMNTRISDDDNDDYLKQLPVGYRFLPNDDELVHYLRMKVKNEALPFNRLRTIDLYQYSPQHLSHVLGMNEEAGWYFFTRLQSKNKGAKYANRTTPDGNWKATSGDNKITNGSGEQVGTRKALVYYEGKSKTDWIMHEYRLKDHSEVAHNLVICRIHKNHNNKAIN